MANRADDPRIEGVKLILSVIAAVILSRLLDHREVIAWFCALYPAIWTKQAPLARRFLAGVVGIGVAVITAFCVIFIALGLSTWAQPLAQIANLIGTLLRFAVVYLVSWEIVNATPNDKVGIAT
jgi:hypothetical protein